MATAKDIFDGLQQYPLPAKSGVKDYVFYFVPNSDDGYGARAHDFFKKFYPTYAANDVVSIEQMIGILFKDVSGGVKQIRELVIVAHGTPQGLIVPVLTAATATANREYLYLTEKSLSYLQRDFAAGDFSTFKLQRSAVVAHLLDDSWVTIRACRVGLSDVCMYAYFSFFGGRANVYAPKLYQVFASMVIGRAGRVRDHLQMHEFLSMQHFFPTDEHTPDRQELIVQAFLDPAKFAAPVQLATMKLKTPSPGSPDEADAQAYESLINDLNARKISVAVQAAFTAAGNPLTPMATMKVRVKDQHWLVIDTIKHTDGPFIIDYEVEEVVDTQTASLMSSAHVDARSTGENFPGQLFFDQDVDDEFRGKLFQLAAYADGTGTDATNMQLFTALTTLLDGNQYSDGTHDLAALFKAALNVDLSATPNISPPQVVTLGNSVRKTWTIGGSPGYVVKQELPVAEDGTQGHTLTVYLDDNSRLLKQAEVVATEGEVPDIPGTELQAYFDGFSIDELTSVLDYLRDPYRAPNSYYIRQAMEAMSRKKEFRAWSGVHAATIDMGSPLAEDYYQVLRMVEHDDIKTLAFDFDFNKVWQEVKVSFPAPTTFKTDLYAEEDLWTRITTEKPLPDRADLGDLYSETPDQQLDALRSLEKQGIETEFSTDKMTYVAAPSNSTISCDDFKTIIEKWKELQGQPVEQIKDQLSELLAPDGASFFDHLWDAFEVFDKVNAPFEFLELVDLGKSIPAFILDEVGLLEESAALSIVVEWIMPVLPGLLMWLEFVMDQQEAVEVWERKGMLVSMIQMLEGLAHLAYQGPVPDDPVVDIGDDSANSYSEVTGRYGSEAFIPYPDDFQKGFEEGKEQMDRVIKQIVSKADEGATAVLSKMNLDACKLEALKDAGIIDANAIRSAAIQAVVKAVIAKMPNP
jgi:hypothetical protein